MKGKIRVFALTDEKVSEDLNVMASILSRFELPAYALIHSRATLLFISTAFIAK